MLCSGDDDEEIINYYKKSSVGLSNNYTYISTEYSNIQFMVIAQTLNFLYY